MILLQLNYLVSGLVVVEMVFAYPGFGRMMLEAALNKDIVPSKVVEVGGNPWGLSHSPVAWLTVLLLGVSAAYFLARMANDERQARGSSIVQ